MRFAQHLTALRKAWRKQMPTWSVKTRHASSRHYTEARVYGRTTTAMHEIEYPPLLIYPLYACGVYRLNALN